MSELRKYKDAEVYISNDAATGLYTVESHDVYLAADVEPVLKDVRDTMTNLLEYWNGNHNERAMVDALEHMEREAMRLLARLEPPQPPHEHDWIDGMSFDGPVTACKGCGAVKEGA